MKKQILTGALLFAVASAMAQRDSITISGVVTDAASGTPVPGVRIEAYGNNRLTAMTNGKGEYSLQLPAYVSSVTMMGVGYQVQQVPIGRHFNQVNGLLYSDSFSGNYSRRTVATVDKTVTGFENNAEESIDPLIHQRLGADVRTMSRGGNEGVGYVMFIGGLNSFQSNAQPLVVVDGVITDLQYGSGMLHDGYFNNILSNFNVNDIEKVTVLKNGTAIYGAKGANGVILINTKRNNSMATKIDVTVNGRYELTPRLPEMLGAEDYRIYATELLGNQTDDVSALRFVNTDPTYYYYKPYHNQTNWKNEVYRNSFSSNYGINVQGGDEVASYNLSVGYSMANSTLKNNDFSRFNMRLNTDISVLKNLDLRFDASYSDVNRNLRDDGIPSDVTGSTITSPGFLGLIKAPFLSPYAYDVSGHRSNYLSAADDYLSEVYGSDVSLANPNSILEFGEGKNRNTFGNRFITLSATPRYQFNRHLSLSEHFCFTLLNTNENYYLPLTGVPAFRVKSMSNSYVNNMAESLAGRQNSIQSDTRLAWDNRFGAHSLNVFGGVRYLSSNYKLNVQRGYNTGNDKTPNMSTSLQYKSTEGADNKIRDITWYANADYNFAERYYLAATLSAEASSRFGSAAAGLNLFGTVWGLFPSVEVAWVLSNERWFDARGAVNYLKLNVGFDVTGNDDIDYTASRTYFVANNMLGRSVDGKSIGNIGNDELKWETTRRFTAGLTGNFFNNRLSLGIHTYKSWTSDLLTLGRLAWTSGIKQNWTNGGKLENVGFDVSASWRVLNEKNVKWELSASVGHYKNKLTALSNDNVPVETSLYGATVLSQVGMPVGVFYGYKTAGVFSTQAEVDAAGLYLLDESGNRQAFRAGDMHFVDVDGNHEINAKDRQVIGDPNPDFYGNLTTSISWKRWNLTAIANYSLGNDIYNYQRSVIEGGSYFYNQTTAMNQRWTTEGQHTSIPRVNYSDPMGNSRFSDRWIEDGSYLRLRTVTLSYTWPMDYQYLKGLTLWASVGNLFTLTHYLGSDPDNILSGSVLSQGIDRGLLGHGRSFSMGVKINL